MTWCVPMIASDLATHPRSEYRKMQAQVVRTRRPREKQSWPEVLKCQRDKTQEVQHQARADGTPLMNVVSVLYSGVR